MQELDNPLNVLRLLRANLLLEMSKRTKTGRNIEELRSALLNNDLAILQEEARVKEEMASKLRRRFK
jgi:hypothetical protein